MSDSTAPSERPIKYPSPDHPISLSPHRGTVTIRIGGIVVAQSDRAMALKEANYPEVFYIPRSDVDMSLLRPTDHRTYCPYKGEAGYFSVPIGGDRSINAAWTYEHPYPAVRAIEGHLAFYADRID